MSRVLIRETGEYIHPDYRIIYFDGYLPYPPSINHYWKLGKTEDVLFVRKVNSIFP